MGGVRKGRDTCPRSDPAARPRRAAAEGVDPRSIAVAGVLILSAALSLLLAGCTDEPRRLVMDDFESRELADWRTVSGGAGGWFVYTDGQKAPDPAHSDPNVPFDLPNPPQGTHAAVTDMNGPGTRILYRDVTLDGRLRLHEGVLRRRRLQQPGYPRVRRARGESAVQNRPRAPLGADRLGREGRRARQRLPNLGRRSGPPRADPGQRRRVALGGPDRTAAARRRRQQRPSARRSGRHPLRRSIRARTPASSFRTLPWHHAP